MNVEKVFQSDHYMRHTQRRQEHLATLGLPLDNKSVLEVGAGIGDHTSFFLDRGSKVITSDAKFENVAYMEKRFKDNRDVSVRILFAGLNDYGLRENPVQIVYCYGLLYHLEFPELALQNFADYCSDFLLLETQVSHFPYSDLQATSDSAIDPSGSVNNIGCLPSRAWVMNTLSKYFPYVYMVKSQPWHEEFPLNWVKPSENRISRAVFVASKSEMDYSCLSPHVLDHHRRC